MTHAVRRRLVQITPLRIIGKGVEALVNQFGLSLRWVGGVFRLAGFAREFHQLRRMNRGGPFAMRGHDIYPFLTDRTSVTPIEPIYFLQDAWFARKIAEQRPSSHVDVGSSAKSMAIIAQFVPITFIDIRPVDIQLERFSFKQGSVLALPYADGSLSSLSSICVIEHIGLGRYGDPFDARGSEKAAAELLRVLAPGGNLYITVPVDRECRIYFNAHRAFTRDYLLGLFPGLTLVEERYIYGRALFPAYDPQRGFGTGLYHLRRP